MNVLLLQLDGVHNLALMRVSGYHLRKGDSVDVERQITPDLFKDYHWDRVYASVIFQKTRPVAEKLLALHPSAIIGGTGWDHAVTLEQYGISSNTQPDYSLFPKIKSSIGFSQRGCRLRCGFCVVPTKEGGIKPESTIAGIWRGEPHPKEILLLDNDFFGQPEWRERINEIRDGGFKVSFNQGINIRFITKESAEAIASVDYYDDQFKTRRIYTAWDNAKDEKRFLAGIETLMDAGVAPSHIMVYMLVGYWPGETAVDRNHRLKVLRSYGVMPYPMPYVRTPELVGFQRWVITHYDQKIPWYLWQRAGYQPYRLKWSSFRSAPGTLPPLTPDPA